MKKTFKIPETAILLIEEPFRAITQEQNDFLLMLKKDRTSFFTDKYFYFQSKIIYKELKQLFGKKLKKHKILNSKGFLKIYRIKSKHIFRHFFPDDFKN